MPIASLPSRFPARWTGWFVGVLLCLCPFSLPAHESDSASVYLLNTEKGLPSNLIYYCLLDSRGFLWIGTDRGLILYDGYTLKVFTVDDGLPSNDIVAIQEDTRGVVWPFSLANHLGYMRAGKYRSVTASRKSHSMFMADLHEYRGNIYFKGRVSDGKSVFYKLDPAEDTLAVYKSPVMDIFLRAECFIRTLSPEQVEYRDFLLHDGCFRFGKTDTLSTPRLWLARKMTIAFRSDTEEAIGYQDFDSLEIKDIDGHRVWYLPHNERNDPLFKDRLMYVTSIGREHFVIQGNQVYRIDSQYNCRPILQHDLPGTVLYFGGVAPSLSVFIERDKGIYLKTDRLDRVRQEQFFARASGAKELVWSNSYSGTLLLHDFVSTVWLPWEREDIIRTFSNDKGQYLTTVTDIYRKKNGRWESIWKPNELVYHRMLFLGDQLKNKPSLSSLRFIAYHPGRDSNLSFVSMSLNGLHKIVRSNDTCLMIPLHSSRLTNIVYDSSSGLLLAFMEKELFLYRPDRDKALVFDEEYLATSGIGSISQLYPLGNNRFLIKSQDQLYVYNLVTRLIRPLPHSFGLGNALLAVAGEHLFAAGHFGIATVPLRDLEHHCNWHILPNFKGSDYNTVNDLVCADSSLFLGTDKGIFTVSKEALLRSGFRDSVALFRLFLTTDSMLELKEGDTINIEQQLEKAKLEASNMYGAGTLVFNCNVDGAAIKNFTQINAELYLRDYAPGHYYPLVIQGRDAAWHSKLVTVYLYRVPYWYQTSGWVRVFWIGGVLLFLLFVGTVVLTTRYFVRKSNVKKQQLIELELRALYSQINPHFIFNSLNSAQYFINAKDIDKAYDHVSKFAKLLRAYLKSSHDRHITIAEEVAILRNYIELQQERFKDPFSYNIRIDNKIPAANVQIPSLLLQPLVENAINHGLFHKKERGHLSIEFLQGSNSEEIICIIEDDGVGRERAKEISRENAAARFGSYGTRLTEQLIDIFERYEQMNIQVSYSDKVLPQTGTVVTLTIRNIRYVP